MAPIAPTPNTATSASYPELILWLPTGSGGDELVDRGRVDVQHAREHTVAARELQRQRGAVRDGPTSAVEERHALVRRLVGLVVGVERVDRVLDLRPQRAGGFR